MFLNYIHVYSKKNTKATIEFWMLSVSTLSDIFNQHFFSCLAKMGLSCFLYE